MPSKRRLRWAVLPVGIATAVVLAGCTPTELHGYLPGFVEDGTPTTNHTDMVAGLWVNSWIVLLAVGVITWGLMGWAAIAYRRRKGQVGLPVQLRYNMPIEIFYTIVPLILVIGFFAFTARDQTILETQTEDPDVSIIAIGKQWAWDFQYNGEDEDGSDAVWSMGVQAQPAANGDVDQERAARRSTCRSTSRSRSCCSRATSSTRSGSSTSCTRRTCTSGGTTSGRSRRPARAPTRASAPSCAASTTPRCSSTSRSSAKPSTRTTSTTLRDAGQTGDINDEYDRLEQHSGHRRTTSARKATDHGDHASAAGEHPGPSRRRCRPARPRCSAPRATSRRATSSSSGSPPPTTRRSATCT